MNVYEVSTPHKVYDTEDCDIRRNALSYVVSLVESGRVTVENETAMVRSAEIFYKFLKGDNQE